MREQIELLPNHAELATNFINVDVRRGEFFAVDKNFSRVRNFKQFEATEEDTLAATRPADNRNAFQQSNRFRARLPNFRKIFSSR